MPLTLEDLAQTAVACMAEAAQVPEPARLEEDARAGLRALVDDRRISFDHRDALRAIERALDVDMTKPANRKGELPQALGLVSRESKETAIKHRAIVLMMGRLLEYSEVGASGEATLCYELNRDAIDAVVNGFYGAGIDTTLTVENVEKIWNRREQASEKTRW